MHRATLVSINATEYMVILYTSWILSTDGSSLQDETISINATFSLLHFVASEGGQSHSCLSCARQSIEQESDLCILPFHLITLLLVPLVSWTIIGGSNNKQLSQWTRDGGTFCSHKQTLALAEGFRTLLLRARDGKRDEGLRALASHRCRFSRSLNALAAPS